MMDRRAFLVAVILAGGCGPNESPERSAAPNQVTPMGADTPMPGSKQPSANAEPQARTKIVYRIGFLTQVSRATISLAAPISLL